MLSRFKLMSPYFSVVIPLYNKAKDISNTIASVLSQTFKDFEIIVVNDGSTDNSLAVLEAINDKRLQLYTTDNKGVSHARNFGVKKSSASLIAFLDADDIWKPQHLDHLKSLHETFPDCGMYCKAYNRIKGTTIITSVFKDLPKKKEWKGVIDDYFHYSTINSLASSSSIAIPKSILDTIGYFNENYTSGEDTDLWIRIALQYPTAFDNTISVTHNLNAEEKLTNTTLKSRKLFDLNNFLDEEKQHPTLKKYLDLNRYALAFQYKLEQEEQLSKALYNNIDLRHLSKTQQWVYKSPKFISILLLKFRDLLRRLHVDLRLFS